MVVSLESTNAEARIYMNNAVLRASSDFEEPARTTLAFKAIRKQFFDLGFDNPDDVGTWDEVPILKDENRGTKRQATQAMAAPRLTPAARYRTARRPTD
jgi:hypothetical protein